MIGKILRGSLALSCLLAVSATTSDASAVVMTFNSFAAFQAATGALTVENFDAAPWVDGSNANGTTNLGVTWTAETDLFGETTISRSAPRSLMDGDAMPDTTEQLNAELPDGITAVGVFFDTYGHNLGVRMTASDEGDSLLGFVDGPMTTSGTFSTFLGIVSTTTPIARVSFLFSGIGGEAFDFAIDDFHFGQAIIPEPGALALFGLGLAGLGFARRRKA